jgi:hypothetical protein
MRKALRFVTALSSIIFRDRTRLSEVTRKNQDFTTDKLFHATHWLWLVESQLLAYVYVGQSSNFQMHPPAVYANNTRVKKMPMFKVFSNCFSYKISFLCTLNGYVFMHL